MWTVFATLKHNTSPAIDGDAFASAAQTPGSVPSYTTTTSTAASTLQHHRPAHPPTHDVSPISATHSRKDPFTMDYGIWPLDRDYAIVCTVPNHMLHTIPTAPCLRRGKRKCVTGVATGLSADTKVTSDATHQVTVPHAFTTLGPTLVPQGNNAGTTPASSAAAPQAQLSAPPAASTLPQPAAPGMRYGPT